MRNDKGARAYRAGFVRLGVLAMLTLVSVTLSSCGSMPAAWRSPGDPNRHDTAQLSLSITGPGQQAKNVPTSAEVGLKINGATKTEVDFTGPNGKVPGALRADGSGWVPAKQLAFGTAYKVKVIARNDFGQKAEASTSFTTMARPGGGTVTANITSFSDGEKVGVGIPVVVELGQDIPQKLRADVERRLFVQSNPPQVGAWHWFKADQVHFRPKDYWKPGTKINVRLGVGGLPMGGGVHGDQDVTGSTTVGDDLRIDVDNNTKQATVTKAGKTIRTMPVSLGKPSTPSSSGNLLVMSRSYSEIFDSSSYGVPVNSPEGYRITAYYTERLTSGGEYLHSAPWSVEDQGIRNVSHGCINLSQNNASWLYDIVTKGTPVAVRNTEVHVQKGDGWTDWDMNWATFLKGSALPPPFEPPTPSPSAGPSATPSVHSGMPDQPEAREPEEPVLGPS